MLPSDKPDCMFIISLRSLYCFKSSRISVVVVPEPFAILPILLVCFSRISGFSISSLVIEDIADFQFFILDSCFSKASFGILAEDIPGIIPTNLSIEPILFICSSWLLKSWSVNFPSFSRSSIRCCCLESVADLTCSRRD